MKHLRRRHEPPRDEASEAAPAAASEAVRHRDVPFPGGTLCPSCAAPTDPGDRFCPGCGATLGERAAPQDEPAAPKRHLRCEACGAEVSLDLDRRSYTCAFCDSNFVVEFSRDESNRQSPEFVIGFRLPPDKALEHYHDWMGRGNWFRPGDLRRASVQDRLVGVYLPFWSFSMRAKSRWSAVIGEYWWRTETYVTTVNGKPVTRTRQVRETEWWPLAGKHHDYYSGYLVSGSRGLPQSDAERIKPFLLPALKRYAPSYLAGWLCEEYTVERESALQTCRAEFARRERNAVAAFLPGDTHRSLEVATEFEEVNSDLVLLPVYILSYRYRDRVFRFLLNGQTGTRYGQKPLSVPRVAAAVVGGVLAILALVLAIGVLAGH